jgi:hypothetical protein
MDIQIQNTSFTREELEKYSSAITLTSIELEMFPDLVQAQWLANMMSPILWEWEKKIPKRSGSPTRRKVEGIKQYIIHNYNFTHMEGQPGLCPCGVTEIEKEEKRFPDSAVKNELFKQLRRIFQEGESTALAELLGTTNIREFYNLSGYPEGTIPTWGNEIIEKMDAYKDITADRKGSGKCEALAALYAAALVVVGKFPWQHVSMWFTPSHVLTYLMEGDGYLSSNKRMFSATSLRNLNEHTAVVKSCLEKENIRRVQQVFGYIHEFMDEYSVNHKELAGIYDHFRNYARLGKVSSLASFPMPDNKKYLDRKKTINFQSIENAKELQKSVEGMAKLHPYSAYDLARYTFRILSVDHPEVYAYAARYRNPKIKQLAMNLVDIDKAIEYVQKELGSMTESIFGSTDRIAMPDEVMIFEKGDHRDRALMLYALIVSLELGMQEPLVVFAEDNSFVFHDNTLIPVRRTSKKSGKVILAFNSSGHVRNLNQVDWNFNEKDN